MTSDKQTHGHLAKPFTPTLSAAFHRTNKSPLTPKLAHSSPGQPAARRLAQSDHTYSTPQKDDPPTVPPTFLSANVTPRSGSRNTRRDAAFPSPTNTPPVPSPQTPYSQPPVGLGLHAGRRAERSPARGARPEQPRSLRAKTLTADGPQSSRPNTFNDLASASPRFFHASDARSNASSEVEPPRPKPGKMSPASSFVYANGENERQSSDDAPLSTTAKRRSGGLVRPPPTSKPAASPSPRLKSPRLSDATSPPSLDSQLHCGPAPEAAEETLMRIGSPPNIPNIVPDRPHRPSIGRHTKSSSVDSSHHTPSHEGLRASPIIISNAGGESPVPVMSEQIPTLRPRVFSNGSSVSASTDAYQSMPLSPGKSDGGDALNNARTERKIMDLEISNSSLLAINRTLEREMRKQNAELRRYRRLSRSGRISMAPTTRSFSGTALSTTSEVEEGVSELSSIRTQDEFSDYSDEESMPDEGVMSPDSLAEHDAKHRAHDEKRFMLDLARHQELLVDSQKMNHSLKRCLGWTEELIKEGQRALEYSVHVQDVELGGRVLSPEELGEVGESGRGLLSPSVEYSAPFLSDDLASDALTDPATLPLPSSPGGTE